MSSTTYSLSLARSANGNWSLEPNDTLRAHPLYQFPPMAFPASMDANTALAYAASLLQTAKVPSPNLLPRDWNVFGRTVSESGSVSDAYRVAWSVQVSLLPA